MQIWSYLCLLLDSALMICTRDTSHVFYQVGWVWRPFKLPGQLARGYWRQLAAWRRESICASRACVMCCLPEICSLQSTWAAGKRINPALS